MAKSIEDAVAGLKEKDNGKDNNKDNNTPVTPQIKTYTVTFKVAGGSAVKAQQVEEGKSVSKPKNPTRKGYKFAGWYTGKTAYKFDTPVKKNLTLTAKWTKIKVKKIKIAGMSKQIAAGKKIKLKVTVTPKTAANRTVKWKSSLVMRKSCHSALRIKKKILRESRFPAGLLIQMRRHIRLLWII